MNTVDDNQIKLLRLVRPLRAAEPLGVRPPAGAGDAPLPHKLVEIMPHRGYSARPATS
jgi:hypothetical protein